MALTYAAVHAQVMVVITGVSVIAYLTVAAYCWWRTR